MKLVNGLILLVAAFPLYSHANCDLFVKGVITDENKQILESKGFDVKSQKQDAKQKDNTLVLEDVAYTDSGLTFPTVLYKPKRTAPVRLWSARGMGSAVSLNEMPACDSMKVKAKDADIEAATSELDAIIAEMEEENKALTNEFCRTVLPRIAVALTKTKKEARQFQLLCLEGVKEGATQGELLEALLVHLLGRFHP